jgi:long-chain acyl-CoA synthetase
MQTIIEILRQSCLAHASSNAFKVKIAGKWIGHTYEQLWSESEQVAAALSSWGLEQTERCALIGPSSPAWVAAYLGILKANGITVPIDKELKQGELRHILADCGARVIFTEQAYLENLIEISEELPELTKIVLLNPTKNIKGQLTPQVEVALASLVNEWKRLAREYSIQDQDRQQFETLAEGVHSLLDPNHGTQPEERKAGFLSRLAGSIYRNAPQLNIEDLASFKVEDEAPPSLCKADDTAVILYTSGTTGRSKGAMLSHANIVSNIEGAKELFDLDETMTTLSFLPINHVFEQVCGILLPLSLGGTVSFAESLKKIGENLAEVKPNFLLGVPAVFRLLHDRLYRKVQSQPLSRLLHSFGPTRPLVVKKIREALGGAPIFVSGGAALDPVVEEGLLALGVAIYQGYGITETSPVIAAESPKMRRLGTVGTPLKDVEIKIYEPNSDGVGEIWVKGPNVMQGYFNNPEATAEALTDGWYHTGDIGRLDDDGVLSICGRVKNLIVTANGKNVYPEEVENELLNSPFIAEVMVYGHKVNDTAEEVYAMIYPEQATLDDHAKAKGQAHLSLDDVETIIRQEVLKHGRNLADYKRIKRFTLREHEFPKTTTRKIKRFVVEADIDAQD